MSYYGTAIDAQLNALRVLRQLTANWEAHQQAIDALPNPTDVRDMDLRSYLDLLDSLPTLSPVWWSNDLAEAMKIAAESFPVDTPITPETFSIIGEKLGGWFFFETPLWEESNALVDIDGNTSPSVPIKAICWQWAYSRSQQTYSLRAVSYAEMPEGWWPVTWCFTERGNSIATSIENTSEPMFSETRRILRFVVAAATWLSQELITLNTERLNRTDRKRLAQPGHAVDHVKVVYLRRHKIETNDDLPPSSKSVDWSCRWVVSGHWRNQQYRSQSASRLIWVGPYIKGPEDKPLKQPSSKVFAVVR